MTSEVDPDLCLVGGVCNHCLRYDRLNSSRIVPPEQRAAHLNAFTAAVKRAGRGREYDCIIGVSGGADSSYVAMKVIELGLRPLAVHVDNGWNSELAVSNIEKLLTRLDIDLVTVVLDLREFHDLQRAFLLASTPDSDIPADHAIQAVLWRLARQHGVKFIISGMNFATESISVKAWSYGHSDWRYIRSVHARFGTNKLTEYPHFGFTQLFWTTVIRQVRIASLLNYLDYDKVAAVTELRDSLDWTDYGGKHFESIFTRWFQGYLLPTKFKIDKRRGHLSDLINSHQLTRELAEIELDKDAYSESMRRSDEVLVRKKLGLTAAQFEHILTSPASSFRAFPNSYLFVQRLRFLVNLLRKWNLYPR